MTPFEKWLLFLTENWRLDLTILAKIGVMVFLVLYLMFSLMVVKQISLMRMTVNGLLEKELALGAKVLVGLAVVVLVMGMIIL